MDNLCHTLVGAALGEAGLARRKPLATATLLMGANLSDVVAVEPAPYYGVRHEADTAVVTAGDARYPGPAGSWAAVTAAVPAKP